MRRKSNTASLIKHLCALVGERAVLLPVPYGKKGPILHEWQKLTFEQTQTVEFQCLLQQAEAHGGNIGVVCGPVSGACSIDIDLDGQVAPFGSLSVPVAP
jgi:hypothetical protein